MNAERLLELFEKVGEAPGAVERLRAFVRALAVRGKLAGDYELSRNTASFNCERAESREGESQWAVPRSWRWITTADAGDSRLGKMLDKSKSRGSRRRYLRNANVRWFDFDLGDVFEMPFEESELREFELLPGDVLVCEGGEPGRAAVWDGREVGILFQKALHRVRLNQDVSPRYFVHCLRNAAESLRLEQYFTGTGIKHLTGKGLAAFAFPVPPMEEQLQILERLDSLLSMCDRLDAARQQREVRRDQLISASLQRLREPVNEPAVLRERAAFHLRHMGRMTTRVEHVGELREAVLAMAVRGGLGQSPRAKDSVRLGRVASLQNGYAFKSEWFEPRGVRLLRNINVTPGGLRWNEVAHISDERAEAFQRFALKRGDIVLSLDRPFIANGTKVARVSADDGSCLLLQRVGRFVVDTERLDEDFLFMWLQSEVFSTQLNPGRSNGVPHVSSQEVQETLIWLPSLDEQRVAVSRANEVLLLCDRLQRALHTDAGKRSALLEHAIQDALRTG